MGSCARRLLEAYLCTPMAYNKFMEFIESHIFEKQVNALLSDDAFELFQRLFVLESQSRRCNSKNRRTTQGSLGGPRKRQERRRAGVYFFVTAAAQRRLIAIYKKGIKDDLMRRRETNSEETQRKLAGSTMAKKLIGDLVESMQQHNEVIAGTRKPARITKVDAQSIRVLRARAGLTQEKFAALIQVELSTLRNWEQGRREPTGPAKALIRAITNDPKHVLKALEVGAMMRKTG